MMGSNQLTAIDPKELLVQAYERFTEKHPDIAELATYALGALVFSSLLIDKINKMRA